MAGNRNGRHPPAGDLQRTPRDPRTHRTPGRAWPKGRPGDRDVAPGVGDARDQPCGHRSADRHPRCALWRHARIYNQTRGCGALAGGPVPVLPRSRHDQRPYRDGCGRHEPDVQILSLQPHRHHGPRRFRHRDPGRRLGRRIVPRLPGGLGRPQRLWPVACRLGDESGRALGVGRALRQARHAGDRVPRLGRQLPVVHRREPVCRPLHPWALRPADASLHHHARRGNRREGWRAARRSRPLPPRSPR